MSRDVVPERQVPLDALFTWTYTRLRGRFVHLCLWVSGLGILLLAWPAQYFTIRPLWGPGDDGHGWTVAMTTGAAITVMTLVWTARTPFRPIIDFTRGRPVEPEVVWHAAVRRLPGVAALCTASYALVGNSAVLAAVGPGHGFDSSDYVGAWLVAGFITATAGFFYLLIWEVALRPVLRDVQPLLPHDFAPGTRWMRLSRRSALASATAMTYTGAAVSSLVAGTSTREGALLVAVGATLVSAITFGGVITALVSHSIFMRVDELKDALVRVGRGEYDVRVAVRAGDELDEAATSLNRMGERLQRYDADLRASRARLASIADIERQRMERDLRQRVLTRLQDIADEVVEIEDQLAGRPQPHRLCSAVHGSVVDAVREISRLASGVYPPELTESGLVAALTSAAGRAPLPTRLDLDGVGRLSAPVESAVYFCCSEAMQNAAKHAGAGAGLTVRLSRAPGRVSFEVSDDGRGLDSGADGHGLDNMRDRIRAVGGEVQIRAAGRGGTTVSGWVPG